MPRRKLRFLPRYRNPSLLVVSDERTEHRCAFTCAAIPFSRADHAVRRSSRCSCGQTTSAAIHITARSHDLSRVSPPVWRADRADRGRTDREQRARVDLEQGCKVNSQLQQHEPFVIVLTAMIICLPMTAQAADETLT